MALHSEPLCNAQDDKKRKMKTPMQLEVLEQVFAEEKYPSEALRARLSIQLGLSNRQLKMWFCHRRLKERKSKGENEEHGIRERSPQQLNKLPTCLDSAILSSPSLAPSRRSDQSSQGDQLCVKSHHLQDELVGKFGRRASNFEEGDLESFRRKRSRHALPNSADCLRVAELQAIASVEAQLGEPLRLDSPCLGVEFDPLPAGAFSTPAAPFMQLKPSQKGAIESSNASKPDPWLPKHDASSWVKSIKVRKSAVVDHMQVENSRSGPTSLQEYQFIPECPTGLTSACEKSTNSNMHVPDPSRHGLSVQCLMLRGSEGSGKMCKFGQTAVSAGPGLSLKGDVCSTMMYPQLQLASQDLLSGVAFDAQYVGHGNPRYSLPAAASFHDIEKVRTSDRLETGTGLQKQKCEERGMAREVEAHTKRVQKDLEREELSRRKREEQLQKEHEKEIEKMLKEKQREDERLFRDKQREDERLQRERQREDERLQREARRESERQERFLQKEAQRLEREREKEEARRLKEATRLKVAIERATARRIARECVELIDDERLELLEVAATSQGLPSIYLLDGETLHGLDRYKEFLKRFPPSAVKMKKPFMTSPWVDSQHNLGNLFMVWRFLIAFADVLAIWSFTLDELVQAFYDYESCLLAELHIALLKVIVKDVEDMAKASANAGAVNQYTAASTIGGGHLQLVEAAFAWGFNYRNWSRHLNASTWPEILRQFSLAAGYGGFVEKHQQSAHFGDDGRHLHLKGNATASNWRLGITTNAANILKIKGGPHIRKSGSRLTPGTVKFAAFHVLSVEGSHGLLISEIVARIEKYGLRDFSTSKTPESSVAAALSRDTTFFDRVAPSTYCVKPAYQKNPQDAERLLQAALERIRLFQSGILDACDEKDTEGSEEGENDSLLARGAEDCLLNDMHRGSNKERVTFSFKNSSIASTGEKRLGDQIGFSKPFEWLCKNGDSRGKCTSHTSVPHANALVQNGRDRGAQREKAFFPSIDQEVDETHAIEPWVKGLMEGEYSGLSVEERLNALVALVEAVNEGNTIRVALEDRMELATALKRQMWTEAQLDKRRFKEEQVAKSLPLIGGNCAQSEGTIMSPFIEDAKGLDNLSSRRDVSKSPLRKEQGIPDNCCQDSSMIGVSSEKSRAQLKVDIDFRADELYIFRSSPLGLDRRRNRYWQFMTSHASEDPSCGRIFFESSEDGHWEVIDTEEAFNALLANLDTRGVREAHLHGVLTKLENLIRQGMRKLASKGDSDQKLALHHNEDRVLDLSTVKNLKNCVTEACKNEEDANSDDGTGLAGRDMSRLPGAMHIQTINNQSDKRGILERYREFDMWLWSRETPNLSFLAATRVKQKRCSELLATCDKCHDFYWHEDKHCAYCHATFEASLKEDVKYVEHVHRCKKRWSESRSNEMFRCFVKKVPCTVQFLKAQLLHVEAAIPAQALRSSWSKGDCKLWATSLKDASCPSDLFQLLFGLEMAIQRDWLSNWFEPVKEIMHRDKGAAAPCCFPCTTAAVAMRLMDLDSALFYSEEQRENTSNQRQFIPDIRTASAKNVQSCDIESDVLRGTDLKQASINGGVEEARDGHNRAINFHETGKLKFMRSKQTENTSMKKHGTDIASDTSSLVNIGGDKTCRGSRDSRKHHNSGKIESEEQRNNPIFQKVVNPVLHKLQWTRADDARASTSHYDRGQAGWALNGTERKRIMEDDLEEEEDARLKEEEDLLNQRGCPSKKWVDGSEDYQTDSMEEASVDVSLQDEDDYNNGEADHSHEENETYSINYQETYFSDSIDEDGKFRSSDLGSFDETE